MSGYEASAAIASSRPDRCSVFDGQPLLAGTVCVADGTTRLSTVDVEPRWTAQVKSDGTGNNARTDVRFTRSSTGDRVELIYEPGLMRIT
jgi:hypothetical protein